MKTLSLHERIALALTAPCVVTVASGLLLGIGDAVGLPELAMFGALVGAFCSAISILASFAGAIYLLMNIKTIRILFQALCGVVNVTWLAYLFVFALPRSLHH